TAAGISATKPDIRLLAIGVTDEIATAMGWSVPYTLGVMGGWKRTAASCRAVLAMIEGLLLMDHPPSQLHSQGGLWQLDSSKISRHERRNERQMLRGPTEPVPE